MIFDFLILKKCYNYCRPRPGWQNWRAVIGGKSGLSVKAHFSIAIQVRLATKAHNNIPRFHPTNLPASTSDRSHQVQTHPVPTDQCISPAMTNNLELEWDKSWGFEGFGGFEKFEAWAGVRLSCNFV